MLRILRALVVVVLLYLLVDIGRYAFYPDISWLADNNPPTTAFMEHRKAEWLEKGLTTKKIRHHWVPIKKVSQNLVKAVLIAEDDKFWQHEGFDYRGIERALKQNMMSGSFRMGGSTISQQLAKNLYLSPSKNPIRKIKEAILTWRLEQNLSKRRILELYINVAEWGDGIFGIDQAARHYYGTIPARLSARQASRLASILPNPIRFAPEGRSRYVRFRSGLIYAIMRKRGIIIPDYQEVIRETPADTTAVDSVVIGVPDFLFENLLPPDSTNTTNQAEQKLPDERLRYSQPVPAEGKATEPGTETLP